VLATALAFSVFMASRSPAFQKDNLGAISQAVGHQSTATPATKTYRDPDHLFFFDYPANAILRTSATENTDVVVLTDNEQELEIQIAPTTAAAVTVQQIVTELGASLLGTPSYTKIAYNVPLVRARSRDPELGDLTQAWFIRHGSRYQLTVQQPAEPLLDQVLSTWCLVDEPLLDTLCVPR
jgi:hypothetical protein